jgi:hypothetical protein
MPEERVAIDDVIEAAAKGVLRAPDARKAGEIAIGNTADLVRAGFSVQFRIIAGGIPGPVASVDLNPQPLPP